MQFSKQLLSKTLLAVTGIAMSMAAMAADPLANTQWTTYDGGTAKGIVKITQQANGTLSGTIVKVVDPRSKGKTVCDVCVGKFHNKPLTGQTIFWNLKPAGNNTYEGGSIIDPENGKTYSFSAKLDGNTFKGRGYIGVKALGRDQTWKKAS